MALIATINSLRFIQSSSSLFGNSLSDDEDDNYLYSGDDDDDDGGDKYNSVLDYYVWNTANYRSITDQ